MFFASLEMIQPIFYTELVKHGYTVFAVSPSGTRTIASGTFEGGATAIVSRAALANAGFDQIIVRSAAPVAAVEDIAPTGNYGVVAMQGVPLAAAISL